MGLLGALALGIGGGLASTALQGGINYGMQKDSQAFNSDEAQKARIFTGIQNQMDRDFNSAEAQKARDFTERMSNTSYQRGIADMKAAGLNPAVMSGGSGAPVGSSAMAASNSTGAASAAHSSASFIGMPNLLSSAIAQSMAKVSSDPKLAKVVEARVVSSARNYVNQALKPSNLPVVLSNLR